MHPDGHVVYVPYSLQPIVEYIPSDGVYVRPLQKEVLVTDRGLLSLAKWLGAHRVKWVKESTTGIDDGKEELFLMDIEVRDPIN